MHKICFDLTCRNISKYIDGKAVVKDVSIQAKSGMVVALLGPNGAGKTTCFSMLAGLIKPDNGEIYYGNNNITNLPMYKRARIGIGYLPQEASIFTGLNVEENILSVLEMQKLSKIERLKRLDSLINEFSLSHIRKSNSVVISGGERRKLEIARALANNPKYILFDEPLAGIDPIAIAEMRDLIMNLKAKKIGIIITDHNVRDTLPMCDYAYILNRGSIIAQGRIEDIINNEIAKNIYLGETFYGYNQGYYEI